MQKPLIKFYGGAYQLGGNQFLLMDGDAKIFLDFGMNFDEYGKYYSYPSAPKKFQSLKEFLLIGIYPDSDEYVNFDGVYRADYLRKLGRKPAKYDIDAFIFSHAHLDHVSGLHFLDRRMEVWMDPYTKRILLSLQKTSGASFNQFVEFDYSYAQKRKIGMPGEVTDDFSDLQGDCVKRDRNIKVFHPPEPFSVKNLLIEPYYVDHSLPGSCGFIIHTSIGPVVYTGDLRLRGRRREDTEKFIKAAAKARPKYLLVEGSLINKPMPGVEDDVVEHVYNFIRKSDGLVVISYPPRDLDRALSIYKVATKSGRKMVIDTRIADLLERFDGEFGYPKITYKNIAVFMPKKGKGTNRPKEYFIRERKYFDDENRTMAEEIEQNPEKYIMCLSGNQMHNLIELDLPKREHLYIRSHPEPYTEEMELDEKILLNWLAKYNFNEEKPDENHFIQKDLFGIGAPHKITTAHVTGHMSFYDTMYLINEINPEILVPIHTLLPREFSRMFTGKIHVPERKGVLELAA